MARRPNYNFQKNQQDMKKQKKREEKAEKKRLKKEGEAVPGSPEGDDTPDEE